MITKFVSTVALRRIYSFTQWSWTAATLYEPAEGTPVKQANFLSSAQVDSRFCVSCRCLRRPRYLAIQKRKVCGGVGSWIGRCRDFFLSDIFVTMSLQADCNDLAQTGQLFLQHPPKPPRRRSSGASRSSLEIAAESDFPFRQESDSPWHQQDESDSPPSRGPGVGELAKRMGWATAS